MGLRSECEGIINAIDEVYDMFLLGIASMPVWNWLPEPLVKC
jgi:hypothetical protein